MNKWESLAAISVISLSVLILAAFIQPMLLLIMFYTLWVAIIPIVIIYIISIFETLITLIRKGFKASRTRLLLHTIALLIFAICIGFSSDMFKSKRIMTAYQKDDLFLYTLVFREGGNCELDIIGMFGYQETIKGQYYMEGDTIIFSKKPYDNNFIPDTIYVDRPQKAIFLHRYPDGNFITQKEWLNHFTIRE